MELKYYTLSYREITYEGKGDPSGYHYETYLQSVDRSSCEVLAKKYDLKLIDGKDTYENGFIIEEHVIALDTEAKESELKKKADEEKEHYARLEAKRKEDAKEDAERKARGDYYPWEPEYLEKLFAKMTSVKKVK